MDILKFYLPKMILIVSAISYFLDANGQKRPDPTFDTFIGHYYAMPVIEERVKNRVRKRIQDRYGDNIYDYKKLGDIELDAINIPETTIGGDYFPGVDRYQQFCMILNSKMTIIIDGCYEFSLHSDDGSILWIDDQIIVDNDGGHQMEISKDTIALNKGEYDIKLWYFQGMPDRFGFIFDSKLIGKLSACNQEIEITEIKLQSHLLFNVGSYTLTGEANSLLSEIVDSIGDREVKSIDVIGYTDNVGSEADNMILSQNRATTIVNELRKIITDSSVIINATGMGEDAPIATNETSEGRNKNRRVEIIVKY